MPSEKLAEQQTFFANRLKKRFKHLRKWAQREDITAFRVYHKDIPEIPFAVDWYDGHLHMAEYFRPHQRTPVEHDEWVDAMADAAARALTVPADRVFLKRRTREKGGSQYEPLDRASYTISVTERGLAFKINLSDYVDTGLFLDHRELRLYVARRSQGRDVLNLFGYTGSFSVYAAAGGAKSTVTVDLSNTYLSWAKDNFVANGLMGANHQFMRKDATRFLTDAASRGMRFDLIILDPPTFSNSKKMDRDLDIQRDHPELINACLKVLNPQGELVFSTNRKKFNFQKDKVATDDITKITKLTMPEDFLGTNIHSVWSLRPS